jgi:hypothetical protein
MKMLSVLKILVTTVLIVFGSLPMSAADALKRPGITVFKGKLQCVGCESDKFLKYMPSMTDQRGFNLTVLRRVEEGSTFTIEFTKLLCATGEGISQELFGNSGDYFVGNIFTPDKKYLIYDEDKKFLRTFNKIPQPDYANYTWLIFHCIQLDQYFFWPLFKQSMFFQKFRFADVIDVIQFQKTGTDGEWYCYWKLIPEAQAIQK